MDQITFECSNCRQILKVGADKAGRQAKCPRCNTALQIPAASTIADEPAPPPPPRPAAPAGPEKITDIPPSARRRDEEDDRPRRRRDEEAEDRPRRRRDEDDDYDEDRPRRRRRDGEDDYDDDRPRRRRRDEDDDYDDDRPRRRRRDEDDDYDDRPRKKAPAYRPMDRWPKVQIGILIVAIAACVLTAAWAADLIGDLLVLIALIVAVSGGGGAGWGDTGLVFMKIGVIVGVLGAVGGLVGYVFNVFVPNKRGATGLAIAVLAMGVVELVLNIIFKVIPVFSPLFSPFGDPRGSQVVAFIFNLVYWLVFGAQFVLLYLLMANIANQWKQRGQGRDCVGLVVMVSIGAGLCLLAVVMMFIAIKTPVGMRQSGPPAMFWVALVLKLLGDLALLGTFSWSIRVLFGTKDVID
jgi:hypothetical protein